jgi:D-lyxose ketol-isomerase
LTLRFHENDPFDDTAVWDITHFQILKLYKNGSVNMLKYKNSKKTNLRPLCEVVYACKNASLFVKNNTACPITKTIIALKYFVIERYIILLIIRYVNVIKSM